MFGTLKVKPLKADLNLEDGLAGKTDPYVTITCGINK